MGIRCERKAALEKDQIHTLNACQGISRPDVRGFRNRLARSQRWVRQKKGGYSAGASRRRRGGWDIEGGGMLYMGLVLPRSTADVKATDLLFSRGVTKFLHMINPGPESRLVKKGV